MPRHQLPELRRTWVDEKSPRQPTPYPFGSHNSSYDGSSRDAAYDWMRNHVRYVRPHTRVSRAHGSRKEALRERMIASHNDEIRRRPAIPLHGVEKTTGRSSKQVAFLLPDRPRRSPAPMETVCASPGELVGSMDKLNLGNGTDCSGGRCSQCGEVFRH